MMQEIREKTETELGMCIGIGIDMEIDPDMLNMMEERGLNREREGEI